MTEEFSFEVERFDNWDELRRRFDHFTSSWVFRGQRLVKWTLQ